MKLKDLPDFDRPREKLIKKGAAALRKEELLAILLRTGIKGKNVLQVADDVFSRYGGRKLLSVSYEELRNIHGVGSTKAVQILAALELGKRLYREKEGKEVYIHSPGDVMREVGHIRENKKENFVALYLDAQSRLIHKETISIGTLTASLVHPREVFEPALCHHAASVIVAHNHPSGSVEPSPEDREVTMRLTEAGKILGIELADHVIVSKSAHFSFQQEKLLS